MNPEKYLKQNPALAEYIKIIKMDNSSLTDILNNATTHYNRYQNNKSPRERFAYVYTMFTLGEHISVARTEYQEIEKIELADLLLKILNITKDNFEDYTRKHFKYIKRVVQLLDKESITESDVRKCREDIDRIRASN